MKKTPHIEADVYAVMQGRGGGLTRKPILTLRLRVARGMGRGLSGTMYCGVRSTSSAPSPGTRGTAASLSRGTADDGGIDGDQVVYLHEVMNA